MFLLVIEASSPEHVISAKGEAVDPVSMSFQLTLHDASVSLPDLDRSILRCTVDEAFSTPQHLGD